MERVVFIGGLGLLVAALAVALAAELSSKACAPVSSRQARSPDEIMKNHRFWTILSHMRVFSSSVVGSGGYFLQT